MYFVLDYLHAKFQSNVTLIGQQTDQLNFHKTGFPILLSQILL